MTGRIAARARAHLNYATVVTALSVFLLLAGGAAYAAGQLGKNSVGTKQLKKNSVTAAKIKKNAVTAAKIKKDAITGAKFKAGSLGGASFNLASMPYSQVVHVAKGATPLNLGPEPALFSLEGATYTQPAGEDDTYIGAATVSVPASCEGPRRATVRLLIDSTNPVEPLVRETLSESNVELPDAGAASETAALEIGRWRFGPAAPVSHTLAVTGEIECEGGTETAVLDSVEIAVVGTK